MGLLEFIPLISGLEQGRFIPIFVFLNGFRNAKSGIEFGFGPMINVTTMANGYYDGEVWHLEKEWYSDSTNNVYEVINGKVTLTGTKKNPHEITRRLDSRGKTAISASWVWAFGKTFRSGNLNVPVNAFFSIEKGGWTVGISSGFSVNKVMMSHD